MDTLQKVFQNTDVKITTMVQDDRGDYDYVPWFCMPYIVMLIKNVNNH